MPTRPRWATFDCYGTLIDWDRGIGMTLARLWPQADARELLERYHQIEPVVQRDRPSFSYRAVMTVALRTLAAEHDLALAAGDEDALGRSLPDWPVFPEVPAALRTLRERGWRLAVLTNSDPDLIEASLARIGVPFDERVVASAIGSYKPDHGHWRAFAALTGAEPAHHVHVAASLYHDIVPASDLGLRTVWINRLNEVRRAATPTRELPDLAGLPEAIEALG